MLLALLPASSSLKSILEPGNHQCPYAHTLCADSALDTQPMLHNTKNETHVIVCPHQMYGGLACQPNLSAEHLSRRHNHLSFCRTVQQQQQQRRRAGAKAAAAEALQRQTCRWP
jgi:hypothetical protein